MFQWIVFIAIMGIIGWYFKKTISTAFGGWLWLFGSDFVWTMFQAPQTFHPFPFWHFALAIIILYLIRRLYQVWSYKHYLKKQRIHNFEVGYNRYWGAKKAAETKRQQKVGWDAAKEEDNNK